METLFTLFYILVIFVTLLSRHMKYSVMDTNV
jgi:hypothetical protein